MTIVSIRKKPHQYIETGQPKKVKAIFSMVEDEIETDSIWTDEFYEEMNRRVNEFKNGIDKGYSWDEVKMSTRKLIKARKANGL